MILRPPTSTRTATLVPYTTLFRSGLVVPIVIVGAHRLIHAAFEVDHRPTEHRDQHGELFGHQCHIVGDRADRAAHPLLGIGIVARRHVADGLVAIGVARVRSEEHTSELQSLMRISYAVFCLKKKTDSI